MNTAPIGVFDSGLGGLTAVRELRRLLPGEDIVYFGDTGRVPYGSRGAEVIINYAKQDIAFLLSKNVKTIIAACGTVSSTLPAEVAQSLPVPYTGVIQAAAQSAAAATMNGKIGVVGTEATIRSGSYVTALRCLNAELETVTRACPLFVPIVENGHYAKDDALVRILVAEYLQEVKDAGVDTLILGCTHYPLLREAVADFMGEGVALVDPGLETALWLQGQLEATGGVNGKADGGETRLYVTDEPARFEAMAAMFLGEDGGVCAQRVDIESYRL